MDDNKSNNRIDMLRHLSYIGGANAVNVFNSYIPDHYNEIYTLYELLEEVGIDYLNINFLKPQQSGDNFIFLCVFESQNDLETLRTFLENNDSKVKYMRNRSYKVIVKDQLKCTSIKFKHV